MRLDPIPEPPRASTPTTPAVKTGFLAYRPSVTRIVCSIRSVARAVESLDIYEELFSKSNTSARLHQGLSGYRRRNWLHSRASTARSRPSSR